MVLSIRQANRTGDQSAYLFDMKLEIFLSSFERWSTLEDQPKKIGNRDATYKDSFESSMLCELDSTHHEKY